MPKTAFLFPGQGSQYAGMGRELAAAFPEAAAVFAEASEATGLDLAGLCFDGPGAALTLTENAQPAILTASLAAARILDSLGIAPDYVAGHSLGEYSALVYAGGLPLAEGARLVRFRGELMARAMPPGTGGMAAILGLDAGRVRDVCLEAGGKVEVANLNCPGQTVISGPSADLERASALARAGGAKRVIPLNVSGAFHSSLMEPAARELGRRLEASPFQDLRLPLVANVDAAPHRRAEDLVGLLTRQMASPVRWEESMRCLAGQGVGLAVEVGPGKVLAGLMRKIAPEVKVLAADKPGDFEALKQHLAAGGR